MKYACRECTSRSSGTVRPAATSACAATCPPNTRGRLCGGLTPRNRLTSSVSRSRRRTSPSSASWPVAGSVEVVTPRILSAEIVLAQPVHPDQVRGARRAGRRARDDDHEVAALEPLDGEHRVVDLAHHGVGGGDEVHEERLHPPRQRE